tara:strand:- start:669 stop:2045 length:1377 start_codon:yes stop_codon:yes gene_type:complete
MDKNKELIELGLNIHQSWQIEKINKSNDKLNKLIKESDKINKKGHKTTQVMVAAGFVGLAKQNKEIVGSLDVLHDKFAKINNTVEENNILAKKIDNKVDELIDTSKRNEAMLESQITQKKISDDIKQIVFDMGQEVKNIKKNSNALERFVMYLIISDSIKMNSNIKVEIIDTIPGKQAFQEIMDSIENGMNDSFEMIPEKDLEDIRKLYHAKQSLNPMLPEYNKIKDELDINIKEKEEQEFKFLIEKEELEKKSLRASEELTVEIEKGRKEYGEKWYKQYTLNKKPKAEFLKAGFILSLICFVIACYFYISANVPQVPESNLITSFPIPVWLKSLGSLLGLLLILLPFLTVICLIGGIANWVRNNSFLDKANNLESIIKESEIELKSIAEKDNTYLSKIKSAMALLVQKLNSIIPENITKEIEVMEKNIYDKHNGLKNYINLDLLPSIIVNYTKKLDS